MIILFFIIGGLFLFFIYIAVKRAASVNKQDSDESAVEILKKRYAKGEITKEEYDEMKKNIL